jgi:hypothetical protein
MQNTTEQKFDKFELYLDEMVLKIRECQKKSIVHSCSNCEQYLNCILRTDYVKAVYNSMSKGETGGFEF